MGHETQRFFHDFYCVVESKVISHKNTDYLFKNQMYHMIFAQDINSCREKEKKKKSGFYMCNTFGKPTVVRKRFPLFSVFEDTSAKHSAKKDAIKS